MRYTKQDGTTYTSESWVEVPMTVMIPEHVVDNETVAESTTTQLFQKQVRDLTPEQRDELGLTEVEEEAPVDSRFFFSPGSPRPLDQLQATLISQIKATAGGIILEYCPQWKQANLTAQAASLALTFPGTAGTDLAEPYHTAWVEGAAIWAHIQAIRDYSNTLEAEVNALTTVEEIMAWQMHDWPTQE